MKRNALLIAIILSVSSGGAFADVWDPDGATVGSGVSGNWDLITPNWTATADSGANTTWTQGNQADFLVYSNYTVTLTAPITVGNLVTTGHVSNVFETLRKIKMRDRPIGLPMPGESCQYLLRIAPPKNVNLQ